jgi:hypothetical protein
LVPSIAITPTVARPASAHGQHLAEQVGQRALVALDEPRDGGVIRLLVGGDHPAGHVLHPSALHRPEDRILRDQQ